MNKLVNILFGLFAALGYALLALVALFWLDCAIHYCFADDIVELQEVSLDYKKFIESSRSPLIDAGDNPGKVLNEELNIHINLSALNSLYFNNTVHSLTDKDSISGYSGGFKLIGWNYSLGVHMFNWLDVQYEHFSQHRLDGAFPYSYPVENSIGIKVYFFRNKSCTNCVF